MAKSNREVVLSRIRHAVTKTLEGLGFEVKTDKVLGGLFGTVRTVKSGDTDLSNGGKIRLRDANGNPTVITLTIV